jgi:opacity protein-like surface antigen
VPIDGAVKTWLFMANIYYDLGLRALGPFKPYVGFGIGGARVNEDHEIFINRLGTRENVDDWRTTFAYQARVGITYEVNRWLDLSAGYRFVHVNASSPTVQGQRINYSGMNNHSLELGLAVKF